MKRLKILVIAVSSATLLVGATSAAAGSAASWSLPRSIDSHGLTGMSCPQSNLCVAVDSAGQVLTTRDPTSRSARWAHGSVDPRHRLLDVSCTGAFCLAADSTSVFWSQTPTVATSWHHYVLSSPDGLDPSPLTAVTCLSSTLCVAGDQNGDILTTNDPTEGADQWTYSATDAKPSSACVNKTGCGDPVNEIACPSRSLCIAVDAAGDEIYSTNPIATKSWHVKELFNNGHVDDLTSISCASPSLCEIADATQEQLVRNKGVRVVQPQSLITTAQRVFCPQARLCLESDTSAPSEQNLVTLDPGSDQWFADAFTDRANITGAACPNDRTCLFVDSRGRTVTYRRQS